MQYSIKSIKADLEDINYLARTMEEFVKKSDDIEESVAENLLSKIEQIFETASAIEEATNDIHDSYNEITRCIDEIRHLL